MAVAGPKDDDDGQPWHNRTPAVVGASLAAIVVVGILILAAMAVARQFGEPEQAPIDFVEPTYSATSSPSGTTTQTITSTSPVETTDINPSSTSETSGSSTTSSTESSTEQTTARTEDPEDEPTTTRTTRQRPRTNVTRTFNPFG